MTATPRCRETAALTGGDGGDAGDVDDVNDGTYRCGLSQRMAVRERGEWQCSLEGQRRAQRPSREPR